MRIDRCVSIVVALLLCISTLLLVHGIYTIGSNNYYLRDSARRPIAPGLSSLTSRSSTSSGRQNVAAKTSSTSNNVKKKGYFWGDNKPHAVGWQPQQGDRCSEEYHASLPTYDDYITAGITRRERMQTQLKLSSAVPDVVSHDLANSPCDPWVTAAPFAATETAQMLERKCLELMRDPKNWAKVEMIQPRFEQRTIKYVVTLAAPNSHVRLLMKVPQASFATEPFSEITAFALDRALHIGRVPPTVLVPFPLERLKESAYRVMSDFHMVSELGYSETNYSRWWHSEFYNFVRKSNSPRVMVDKEKDGFEAAAASTSSSSSSPSSSSLSLLWVSLQLRLEGVTELLESPLRVPYSKKHSGWHRWFNPRWEGFAAVTNTTRVSDLDTLQPGYERYSTKPYSELLHASMLALSELAIFDFLMLNNDRSPNKNNFVVEGCYVKRKWDNNKKQLQDSMKPKDRYCSAEQLAARGTKNNGQARAARGLAMTFVHLDQGMSFHGFSFVNNPVQKKVNNTFCLFYRPLMERIRCFLAAHAATPDAAEHFLKVNVPEVAQRILGKKKLRWMVGQLSLLVEKKDACVERFGEEVVMQPQGFPRVDLSYHAMEADRD